MDANEIARQRGAQLHAEAVASGHDPWNSYKFACLEAERREIAVESTAAGAVQLDGARAVFIPRDRLILHENVGRAFDQAFLVAHELGHVELGDDSEETHGSAEIDPSRVSEPSPVGVDRVVDYGRKQRREVQMDLFAREFLIPRSVVRQLHIEKGLTASDIAERLDAPFAVVAQQLLDALLLPPQSEIVGPAKKEFPPNPLQEAAANHRGAAYLLEAGPGTGKTQTLALRVSGLLAKGVDPGRILVLTFSNKAAGEMAERIGRKHKEAAAAMWIGTFHAFGLDVVRRFYSELGLPKDPRLMDRTEAVELLAEEFPRLNLVHYRNIYDPTRIISEILTAISRAKDEVVDEVQYAKLAEAMLQNAKTPEEVKAAEEAIEVSKVFAAYEKLKRRSACIDFGDLVCLPVRLLESVPAIRKHFLELYEHVLVDEYQDVNRSSIRLLAALRADGENLWAVGDVKQSIYRFRGASSFNMPRFGDADFAGGKRGRLKLNYRSVSEIVDTFSSFAMRMKVGDAESGLESDRGPSGNRPEYRSMPEAGQQTGAIADAIGEMRAAGYAYRDQAVLCTGNEKLSSTALELERAGIPVLFLGSLFERPEVKDLLALLTLLTDPRAMGLVRSACWPEFEMNMADVASLLEQLRDGEKGTDWLKDHGVLVQLSDDARRAVAALASALSDFDQRSQPWDILAKVLLDRTRMGVRIGESSSIADRTKGIAIWQLMNFIKVQPPGQGLPITRLLDRVRRLLRLGDDRDLRQLPAAAQSLDAVRLMTIHGAKGLEFPVVHIPSLNADTIPRNGSPPTCLPPDGMIEGASGSSIEVFRAGSAEEYECLFFVAISRARDRLFLYAPAKKGDRQIKASPFLGWLGAGLLTRNIVAKTTVPPAPEAADVSLDISGGLRFSGHQLSLYQSCPRRFFYTHVLRVGGRRSVSMFMQTHEVVRELFQSVIAGDLTASDDVLTHKVVEAFEQKGLSDHGYEADYRALATGMLKYFTSTRQNDGATPAVALTLKFGDGQIMVLPDEVVVKPEGAVVLRRIRTGHSRSSEMDDVGLAAFVLAAQSGHPGAAIELLHLSDEAATQVSLTARKLENKREKIGEYLAGIKLGKFPAIRSAYVCPECPAFFICGPTPSGVLLKKF